MRDKPAISGQMSRRSKFLALGPHEALDPSDRVRDGQ